MKEILPEIDQWKEQGEKVVVATVVVVCELSNSYRTKLLTDYIIVPIRRWVRILAPRPAVRASCHSRRRIP